MVQPSFDVATDGGTSELSVVVVSVGAFVEGRVTEPDPSQREGAVAKKIKHQDRIVALRANGVSIRKIADLVGVSPATVQKALRRADGREIVLTVN